MNTVPPPQDKPFGSTLQLLALCPLLAVSDTVAKAVGMSIVALLLIPLATLIVGTLRRWLDEELHLAASLLIVAGLVTATEMLLQAWFDDLGAAFGIFLSLLIANIVIIDHVHTAHASLFQALRRSVRIGLGIALTLLLLSIARELVGRGSLLHGAGTLLAGWMKHLEVKVFSVDLGFLIAMLPPGAFISLGLLIAVRKWAARKWAS